MKKRILSLIAVTALLLSMMIAAIPTTQAASVVPTALVRQNLAKWKNYTYGSGTLYDTGCGMFAIVNAVGYLTGNEMSVTEVASWGHSIGGYNPGSSHDGTYRNTIYPRLQAKYGTRYGFTVDCNGSEGYWAGSSSTKLKNHLKGGGVAIGHVPGHFIAIVGYDSSTNYFHVYDSYPTSARGTGNGDAWVTQSQLASGKLKLDWFCLLTRTGTVINNATVSKKYTVTFDSRGGSSVAKQTVEEGKYASNPGAPSRPGFEFLGWYDENGWKFEFATTGIWANRSLHAAWKAIEWPQTTEYMPQQSNTAVETYTAGGDNYVWPFYNARTGGVTLYKGGADHGWPSVLTTYETSIDLSKYAYLNVSVSATASFNAAILFRDANATTHAVSLSQIVNGNDTDFAPGDYVIQANVGAYLYSHYSNMPSNSVVNIEAIRYYVVGSTDQYVALNAVCFSGAAAHKNTMNPDTISHVPVAGAAGSYTYENGVLTMEGSGGYAVTFEPNLTVNMNDFPYWVFAASASTNFDISMVVTTADGDRRVSLVDDYYNIFGYAEYPEEGLSGGQYTKSLDLLSMYTWNNILPSNGQSTIKSVTVELRGSGRAILRANQLSNVPVVHYYTDTVKTSGSWAGNVRIDNDLYRLDAETDVILAPSADLSAAQVKNGLDNGQYVRLFDGDKELTDAADAKTGLTVRVMNGGVLIKEYILAMRGDVDGTGTANTSDVRKILVSTLDNGTLSVAFSAAADINDDGVVSTVDSRDLLMEIL